ncbi:MULTISPECIES: TetR/AcrR family transcriptional regulator [Actinoplanes]|uniref:TetR/AcrR family transcriptional regulator n=1 Tax=Actinoplanes TaxID=1865 RepID=UPI000699248F|nr:MULTISPECIES: TetR/AcrR family transcriptional regulator [Actinoplanes]GLY05371.1 hypothetical protein Acsp01_57500 [Actinoplanes sp. NBRC 101535]
MSSPSAAGRPRSGARRLPSASAREEILDAAAELFARHGYAATSTRMIAEMVGVRQASLYYHFTMKEQILADLLESTVRPSLEFAAALEKRGLPPGEALRELVEYDVGVLLGARWNVGVLYALPETASEPFHRFRAERDQLRGVYRTLTAQATTRPQGEAAVLGDLVFGLVESVIGMRRDLPDRPAPDQLRLSVAAAALRMIS